MNVLNLSRLSDLFFTQTDLFVKTYQSLKLKSSTSSNNKKLIIFKACIQRPEKTIAHIISAWSLSAAISICPDDKSLDEYKCEIIQDTDFSKDNIFFIDDNNLKIETTTTMHDNDHIKSKIASFYKNIFTQENCQLALLIKSSGTSGKAKYICHSFKNLIHSANATIDFYNLKTNTIWFCALPLYHIGGFMILLRSLLLKSKVVFCDFKDPLDIYQDCSDNKNQRFIHSLVPYQVKKMLLQPALRKSLINLDLIILSGDKIDPNLLEDIKKTQLPVSLSYGMSETASQIHATKVQDITKSFNLGDSKISFSKDKHIIIQSSSLAMGYYQKKTYTPIGDFFTTNDIGKLTNGLLTIEGRHDDIFISAGLNISKSYLKNEIERLSYVNQAYISVIEDEYFGQISTCYLTTNHSSLILTLSKLKNDLIQYIGPKEIPKKFFIIEGTSHQLKINNEQISKYAKEIT